MHSDTLRSGVTLALAVVVVLGGMYVVREVQTVALSRAEAKQAAAQTSDRAAFAERINLVARETEDERAELEKFMQLDILAMAKTFEQVGARAGADVSVTDASEQDDGTPLQGGGRVQWISFVIAAEGSYASLLRTLKLYEQLPIPLEILQLDLQKMGDTSMWLMTIRIRVLAVNNDV